MSFVIPADASPEMRAGMLEALRAVMQRPPLLYAEGQRVVGAFPHSPVAGAAVVQSTEHGERRESENLYRVRDERGVLHLLLESQLRGADT
ncbi:MAG: hypothetical protein KF795_17900 [Labilithrix sp.]|nr:hypothetical protein [Labilithrix sp.]